MPSDADDADLAGTVDTYESVADEYRRRHADRSVVADQIERFLDALDPNEGARILDAGCGPGWESATFHEAGHRPVGIDLTPAFLAHASEVAPRADLARMDMRHLGLADGAFDGVWACASLLHVPREDALPTLEEFRRVVRTGGALQVAVKRGTGRRRLDGYEDDRRQFTLFRPDEFRDLVRAAGFRIEHSGADDTWITVTAVAE